MVEIEYTVKIKDSINPPEFKEGMGKGVLCKVIMKYDVTEEEFNQPMFQMGMIEQMDELIAEHFEVIPKII